MYLVVSDGSVEAGERDEEQEDAGRDDAADDVKAGDHVRRLAVGRDADQQERDHLEQRRKEIKPNSIDMTDLTCP